VVVQRHVGVIGGSGFVGRHVIERLQKSGVDVCNIDIVPSPDPHTTNYIADLRDLPSLTSALQGCDTVIFLAAQWRDDVRPESLYYDVNVGGAANFAHAARTLGIKRCIFTSSVSIYGPTEFEVEEDHPPGAINHYGKSKLEAEQELKKWSASDPDVCLTIIRPTVIFGPGNRGNVWNLLNQIINGPFLMIGNGTNKKSVASVHNIAAFIESQLDSTVGTHIYNYADKPDLDMNQLVALIDHEIGREGKTGLRVPRALAISGGYLFDKLSLLSGRKFGITRERVFKFCANTQYSNAKARATGFVPPVNVEDALKETIQTDFLTGRQPD
jgi:GlcNAc-P-P-Und epimerase